MAISYDIFQLNFHFVDSKFLVETTGGQCHPRASIENLKTLFHSCSDAGVSVDTPTTEWYQAQLLHYGLPPSDNKGTAVLKLLSELNKGLLTVPQSILKLEQDLATEWNNEATNEEPPTEPLGISSSPTDEPAIPGGILEGRQTFANHLNFDFNSMSLEDRDATNNCERGHCESATMFIFGSNVLHGQSPSPNTSQQDSHTTAKRGGDHPRSRGIFIFGNTVLHGQSPSSIPSPQSSPLQNNATRPSANSRGRRTSTSGQQSSPVQNSTTRSNSASDQTSTQSQQLPPAQNKATKSNPPDRQSSTRSQQPSLVQKNATRPNTPDGQSSTRSQQPSLVQKNATRSHTPSGQMIRSEPTSVRDVGWPSPSPNSPPRYVPLGLINGMYNVTCLGIKEQQRSRPTTIILCLDTPRVWGAYDFSRYLGIFLLEQRPYRSSDEPLPIRWRGREYGVGPMTPARENDASWIAFLGNGEIEGCLELDGEIRFWGTRVDNGRMSAPRQACTMEGEWNSYAPRTGYW